MPVLYLPDQLPVQLPLIFLLDRGNVNHTPDFALTIVPSNEHLHELCRVQAVGPGRALAAIDLNARGIDD